MTDLQSGARAAEGPEVARPLRSCALTLALVLAVLTGQHAVFAADRPAPPTATYVAALQRQVDAVAAELATATADLAVRRQALAEAVQAEARAGRETERIAAEVTVAQAELDASVVRAFRYPSPPSRLLLLQEGPTNFSRNQVVRLSLGRSASDSRVVLDRLQQAQRVAETGAGRSRALTEQAVARQQEVDAALAALLDRATRGQVELERAAAAEAVARAEAARAAAERRARTDALTQQATPQLTQLSSRPVGGGAACLADPVGPVANGFLPAGNLCALRTASGHRLRPSAARAFDAMSEDYRAATGSPLCVTDSYRDYAGQVDVFRRKPSLAATPGRSQHGLGLALDLCGGIQTFGSPAHRWMQANAGRFGFTHPGWAQAGGSRPEAWHWEYSGPRS